MNKTNKYANMKRQAVELRASEIEEQTLVQFITRLKDIGAELVDPRVDLVEGYSDDYDYDRSTLNIRGWVPMTEDEIVQAEERRGAAVIANKARQDKKRANDVQRVRDEAKRLGIQIVEGEFVGTD